MGARERNPGRLTPQRNKYAKMVQKRKRRNGATDAINAIAQIAHGALLLFRKARPVFSKLRGRTKKRKGGSDGRGK